LWIEFSALIDIIHFVNTYKKVLTVIFLAVWIWSALRPTEMQNWLLENILVFLFVPVLLVMIYTFKISNLSYSLIIAFMIMHIIGASYTYNQAPLGYAIGRWFASTRNVYDLFVHLSFGLLFFYPIREVCMQMLKTKIFWSYFLPFTIILAASSLYEVAEWLIAINVSPGAAESFIGAQGDFWDTQKDMAAAAVGALLANAILHIKYMFKPLPASAEVVV